MEMLLGVGIVSFLAVLGLLIYRFLKFNALPIENSHARVISKRSSRHGSSSTVSYFVTFEINQKHVELRVLGYFRYSSLSEGMEGTLYYKGNVLMDFKEETI